MTSERRAHLIGDVVKQIVKLTEIVSGLSPNHPEYTEQVEQLERANKKMAYLQNQELIFLRNRLEVIKTDISTCSPGEWVDLEGLRGEIEAKIARLTKQQPLWVN